MSHDSEAIRSKPSSFQNPKMKERKRMSTQQMDKNLQSKERIWVRRESELGRGRRRFSVFSMSDGCVAMDVWFILSFWWCCKSQTQLKQHVIPDNGNALCRIKHRILHNKTTDYTYGWHLSWFNMSKIWTKMFGNQRKCGHRVILEFNHITGPTIIILNNFNHVCS